MLCQLGVNADQGPIKQCPRYFVQQIRTTCKGVGKNA